MDVTLRTPRLILRPSAMDDATRVARFLDNFAVAGNLSRVPYPYRLADAKGWLRTHRSDSPPGDTNFIIDLPGEGAIGVVGFHRDIEGIVIGYWLAQPFWNRGFMSEARARQHRLVLRDHRGHGRRLRRLPLQQALAGHPEEAGLYRDRLLHAPLPCARGGGAPYRHATDTNGLVGASAGRPGKQQMKFLDQAKVFIRSGNGGGGSVSFLREKFLEFGGPNGGNGGRGGDVIMRCVNGLNTLIDYRYQQHHKASTGHHGMGKDRHGAKGDDIDHEGAGRHPGVRGRRGNPDRRLYRGRPGSRAAVGRQWRLRQRPLQDQRQPGAAPRQSRPGSAPEKWIWLRLKLIADAGLVGLPNAGKSTFLAAVSAAKPKIADYPFTTLHPNLGVVSIDDRDFVLADIPGLIEGASEGQGLGDRFLGHVERCAILVHLIDGTQEDVKTAYKTIRGELAAYNEELAEKPELVVLNKIDAIDPAEVKEKVKQLKKLSKTEVLTTSGVTGQGVRDVLFKILAQMDADEAALEEAERRKIEPHLGALMSNALAPYRRLTIKIGSALLVDGKTGQAAHRLARRAGRRSRRAARQGRLAGDRLVRRHRAGPAPAQSRCQGAAARPEPGRRQRRPDRAFAGLG